MSESKWLGFLVCKGLKSGGEGGQRVGMVRKSPPNAQAKGGKDGQRVDIVRESPPNSHAKGGKGGQRVGIVRESPPNPQANGPKVAQVSSSPNKKAESPS